MDLGPQIAVWLQSSSGAFIDTLMVTNSTARRAESAIAPVAGTSCPARFFPTASG